MTRLCVRARGIPIILAAIGIYTSAMASPPIAETGWKTPEDEKRLLHLPPGFEIQLVASEPEIHKPMNLAFDARGRLWVTDTVEYPFPVKDDSSGRDTVKILEDFADDGHAKKITTFADKLNIPLGVLPMDDGKSVGCIAFSIPAVRRFLDTDHDGKADKQDVLLTGFGQDDTHGLTNNFVRGFDGWVYADHGFRNNSSVRGVDGSHVEMSSGNCYRFKIDGTHVEYYSHGQVNPFGLCFDPLGNLFSADCHSKPQYMLLRGAYYPSFGKPDDGLGFGPEMCNHDHGSTAISGTLFYSADQFPPKYRGVLFNGNVVTNCIDSDTIQWHGSSPRAIEAPTFVGSDDPWFRPVQIKLGPDGAVYVADFYNRIIGHYEVDLKHPGRDRSSGRIWRIVYKGDAAKAPAPKMPDLTRMSADELIGAMGDPNLSVRLLAINHWADAGTSTASIDPAALQKVQQTTSNPDQKIALTWALSRRPGFTELSQLAESSDRSVRTHLMRILADTTPWTEAQRGMAIAGLNDKDPFVQRCAADALGMHPDARNVQPLLQATGRVAQDDTHLLHVARIALRDTLAAPGVLPSVPGELTAADRQTIADVALAIPSPGSAAFIVRHLQDASLPRDATIPFIRHAARYVAPQDIDGLTKVARDKMGDDLDGQLGLIESIQQGLAERGSSPTESLRAWGLLLSQEIFATPMTPPQWTTRPLAGAAPSADPWLVELRATNKDPEVPFFSSLPRGEALTGVLRSRSFSVPAHLNFWIAGHNGPPPADQPILNIVRLRAEGNGAVLAEAPAPGNDRAKPVRWDLEKVAGQTAYIEATDGNPAGAWAWLAFGGFEPGVISVPARGLDPANERRAAAAQLAASLGLKDLLPQLRNLAASPAGGQHARAAAARTLGQLDPAQAPETLAPVLHDAGAPDVVRIATAASLGALDSNVARAALTESIVAAPQNVQNAIALALSGNKGGAGALLDTIGAGKASPRLLQNPAILARLRNAAPDHLDDRIAQLTKGMASADEAIQKLIDQRRTGFDSSKASPVRGQEVFSRNCAVCHQIQNVGARVGPQLDGAGKRGTDRLIEDILDPSRNVDAAFRYSILTLSDGDVQTGLQRREEGELLVFADAQGKEFSLPKTKIAKRVESPLSLMPANFGETIKPEELNDLLAYLLSK